MLLKNIPSSNLPERVIWENKISPEQNLIPGAVAKPKCVFCIQVLQQPLFHFSENCKKAQNHGYFNCFFLDFFPFWSIFPM